MLSSLSQRIQQVKFLLDDNSGAILTGVAIAGTVSTAYLTGRATFKAAKILEEAGDVEIGHRPTSEDPEEFIPVVQKRTTAGKVALVWKLYIPPVIMGVTTITSIVAANKLASKKIAALTVASGISERALQEYKEKIVEKLGVRQETAVRDEIAQDRVNNNPPNSREVIITGNGEVLCYDMLTGRYFHSSAEAIKRAENRMNFEILNHMYASLSEYYDMIGLPPTTYTDSVGWTGDKPVNVMISTTMSPDNRPCLAIDFETQPTTDYYRVH
jgi:Family of unknown function (DUF6353)